MSNWKESTMKHQARVAFLLGVFSRELAKRAVSHDASKLGPEEAPRFEEITHKLEGLTYGSPEYQESLKELGPALEHHYTHNRHHPEHHERGIGEMNLVDIIEMICDWIAAAERHTDGCPFKSLTKNEDRFHLSFEMTVIFRRTIAAVLSVNADGGVPHNEIIINPDGFLEFWKGWGVECEKREEGGNDARGTSSDGASGKSSRTDSHEDPETHGGGSERV